MFAVFLDRITRYRAVLEHLSRSRLARPRRETTPQLNIRVLNDVHDPFRFFDATVQAEFLAECVVETIQTTLPREVDYLQRYDQARRRIEAYAGIPDARFDLMIGLLRQNGGRFSRRARTHEFTRLTDEEAAAIEAVYGELLRNPDAPASS
ncbi:MAG: hypothetical protein ACSLFL_13925 [Alphaproteobacteria bacterium]